MKFQLLWTKRWPTIERLRKNISTPRRLLTGVQLTPELFRRHSQAWVSALLFLLSVFLPHPTWRPLWGFRSRFFRADNCQQKAWIQGKETSRDCHACHCEMWHCWSVAFQSSFRQTNIWQRVSADYDWIFAVQCAERCCWGKTHLTILSARCRQDQKRCSQRDGSRFSKKNINALAPARINISKIWFWFSF